MPSINDIRLQFPDSTAGKTDLDIAADFAKFNNVPLERAAFDLGVSMPNAPGFVTGVKQGLGGFTEGIGRFVDDVTDGKPGAITRYGRDVQARNPSSEASGSWEGFKEDPWQGIKEFAGQGLGSTLPSLAAFAIPGGQEVGAAGLFGRGLQAAGLFGRGLQAARAVGTSGVGQTALAAAPIYGQVRNEQELSPEYTNSIDDKLRAGAAALGGGWVESKLGMQRVLQKPTAMSAAQLERQQLVNAFSDSPWKTARNTAIRIPLEEGAEEIVQQPMQQWGAYQDPTTEKSLRDTGWSGVGGVIGSLAMAPFGGVKMGRAHSRIDQYRQTDLLNNPSASIGALADQGQWNRAFVERDEGRDAADQWYANHMSRANDARLANTTTWNEPLAAYQQRVAEAGNPFMGEGPTADFVNSQLGIGQKPVQQHYASAYNQRLPEPVIVPDSNGNPITISTVGEAYDYQHGMGKFAPQEAKVDALGYPISPYQPVIATPTQNTTPSWHQFAVAPTVAPLPPLPAAPAPLPMVNVDGVLTPVQQGTNAPQTQQVAPQAVATPAAQTGTQQTTAPAAQGVAQQPASRLDAFKQAYGVNRKDARIATFLNELDKAKAEGQLTDEEHKAYEQKLADVWKIKETKKSKNAVAAHNALAKEYVDFVKSRTTATLASRMSDAQKAAEGWVKKVTYAKDGTEQVEWVKPEEKQATKAAQAGVEAVDPDEIENPSHEKAVRMHLAGDNLRAIADALGMSHEHWRGVLLDYGYDTQSKKKADASKGETGVAYTADETGNVELDGEPVADGSETDTSIDANPDIHDNDEHVDHSLENQGINIRSSLTKAGVGAGNDAKMQKALAKAKKSEDGVSEDVEKTLRAKNLSTETKLERQQREEREALQANLDSSRAYELSDKVANADVGAATELLGLLNGSNGLMIAQQMRAKFAMPASVQTPQAIVEFIAAKQAAAVAAHKAQFAEAAEHWGEGFDTLPEAAKLDFVDAMNGLGDLINTPAVLRQIKGEIQNEYLHGQAGADAAGVSNSDAQRPTGGRNDEGPGTSGTNQKAVPVVSKKKRRVAVADEAAGRSDSEGQAGEVKRSQGVTGSTTAERITSKLKPLFFSGTRFNNLVTVVDSADALPSNLQSAIDGDTQAFVQGGKVYMIAGNIAEGKELAVFLHEVGVHLGMAKLIGQENLTRLAMQIKRWAAKNDGSQESELAKKALARVKSAQKGGVDMEVGDIIEERVAYFIEEAVNAGINPQALAKSGSPIAQWFRTMWAAAKVALRKFGLDRIDSLSAQNLVDLAYGAARLELEGTWHGTAADFRNFNHSYMGSGEGAQAFGWGTYLAQRAGIAKGYWKDDVRRKGGVEGALMRVDSAVHEDEMLDWDKPLSEQSDSVKEALERVKQQLEDADVLEDYLYRKNADWEELTGKELYSLIERAHRDDAIPAHPDEYVRSMEDDEAASKYLDSIGIKGIKFLDSQSRHTPTHVANVVLDSVRMDKERAESMIAEANQKLKTAESEYAAKVASGTNSFFDDAMIKGDREQHADDVKYWESKKADADARLAAAEAKAKESESKLTRNLVVFNDKNIQRVSTQVGASRDRIKFSKAAQQDPAYGKAKTLVKQLLETVGDYFQSTENALLFGHNLAEKAKSLIPGANKYFESVRNKQVERVRQEEQIAAIAEAHYALSEAEQAKVNKFLDESTSQEKWGYQPEWVKTNVVDAAMAQRFNALSPEAQKVVKGVFKFGAEQQERFDKAVNDNLDPKDRVTRRQMYAKPYAPLKRFGDHVVVGKSAAYIKEKARLQAEGKTTSKSLEDLQANPNHYYVEFVDSDFEAIRRRDALAAANPNLTWDKKPLQKEDRLLNATSFSMLKKLQNQIGGMDANKKTKAALESLANQLYVAQLNRLHANKSQMSRKGVKGYDQDMMRAFVSQGRAEAALIANLKTHAEAEGALQLLSNAAREGSNQDRKTRMANAVMTRHLALLNYKSTPVQDLLLKTNSVYFLLTSPAYYLTNATQPFVISLPYMSAKFGGAKSWSALVDSYKIAFGMTKLFKDNKLDASHLKKFDSVGRESDALQTLIDENLVNIGMEMELGDIVNRSKVPGFKQLDATVGKMRSVVGNVEKLNRLSSAAAAYRLAYTEARNAGKDLDAAHEAGTAYARDVIQKTHGDYSGYNAPTLMMQGAYGNLPVKTLLQFKKFQFIQFGLLAGAAKQAFAGSSVEERALGRKVLGYILGTQMALAGMVGIPLLSGVIPAILTAAFGDDGEDKEEFIRRMLGGGTLAQLVTHGVPAAMGLDISKRVGVGNVADPFRFMDGQTKPADWALSLAGPSAGLASRFWQGVDYMRKGEYWKGAEFMVPNGIANASKALRFETTGVTNSRGDVVMKPEEIGFFDDVFQALGLPTTTMTDRQWATGVLSNKDHYFKEQASKIKHDYVEATRSGEGVAEARQAWMELQAARVRQGFERQKMSDLTNAPKEQAKRERNVVDGIQFTKTNQAAAKMISEL